MKLLSNRVGIYVLILMIQTFVGCKPTIIHQQIQLAEEHLNTNADTSLLILNALGTQSKWNREDIAYYSLVYSIAQRKNKIFCDSDSLTNIALEFYSKKNDPSKKTYSHFYHGCVLMEQDSLAEAMNMFLKAESYSYKTRDNQIQALIYSRLGLLHDKQFNYAYANRYYRKSLELFKGLGDTSNYLRMLRFCAVIQWKLGNIEEALALYNEAKEEYISTGDYERAIQEAISIAGVYLKDMNDPDRAITELDNIMKVFDINEPPPNIYSLLALLSYQKGMNDQAYKYALCYYNNVKGKDEMHDYSVLRLLSEIELERGNITKSYTYFKLFFDLYSSSLIKEKEESMFAIEQRYRNKELKDSNDNLMRENRLKTISGSLCIFILIAIIVIVLQLRHAALKRKDREIEEYALFIEQLENEKNNIQALLIKRLSDKDDEEKRLKEALEKRVEQLKVFLDLACRYEYKPEKFYLYFKQEIKRIKKQKYFEELQTVADHKYNGIISMLKTEYPELTEEDLDICCLVCFGFNTNEISLIYGFTNVKSFYKIRNRVRLHLNLDRSVTIETFIKSFLYNNNA